jgi:hypothetical protein
VAEVSIDIDAMTDLVSAVTNARTDLTSASGSLSGNLDSVWLPTDSQRPVKYDGEIDRWLEAHERDLNRRLSLARVIAASDPTMKVVDYDDSVLSTADDAEIEKRVDRVAELMKVGDDDLDPRTVDPELLKLLGDNALDPYFAQALAQRVSPRDLDRYLKTLEMVPGYEGVNGTDPATFKKAYDEVLGDLGAVFGLASNGTGSLKVPGMAQSWAAYIKEAAPFRDGAVNRLSLVVGRGLWSTDFLTSTYRAIRDQEKAGVTWPSGMVNPVWEPTPAGSDATYYNVQDPLKGWFRAMQSSPDAMRLLFANGPSTTIEVDGQKVAVNQELYDLMHGREWPSDGSTPDGEQAIAAFTAAIRSAVLSPPVAGQQAYQPLLAHDVGAIAQLLEAEAEEAEKERGPLWERIVDGVADFIGLVPIVGDAVDFLHGLTYFARGKNVDGALSMGAVVPFAGWAATGGKWVKDGLKAEELAELTAKGAESVTVARIFGKDGKLIDESIDLADPRNFAPERWLSEREMQVFSGPLEFVRPLIAGNRFNKFANSNYKYSEIAMSTGKKAKYRLDAWTPPGPDSLRGVVVSRKLTQLDQVSLDTAKGYITEFTKKYPSGSILGDTAKNRELGIAGKKLEGDMVLEVPPQVGGKIDDAIVEFAESNDVYIRDINGHWYTDPPE